MKKIKPSVVALACAFTLSACGGGGGSSDASLTTEPTVIPTIIPTEAPTSSELSITAIDGYLENAQVWLDINGNYQWDETEPTAQTNESGLAVLDISDITNFEQFVIVVRATAGETLDKDTNTLITRDFVLTAPGGSSVVTPITTLVEQHIAAETQSIEAAITSVAAQLNLPANILMEDFILSNHEDVAAVARALVKFDFIPAGTSDLTSQNWLTDKKTQLDQIGELIATLNQNGQSFINQTITLLSDGTFSLQPDNDGDGFWDFYDENGDLYTIDNPPLTWPEYADRYPADAELQHSDNNWNENNWNQLTWK